MLYDLRSEEDDDSFDIDEQPMSARDRRISDEANEKINRYLREYVNTYAPVTDARSAQCKLNAEWYAGRQYTAIVDGRVEPMLADDRIIPVVENQTRTLVDAWASILCSSRPWIEAFSSGSPESTALSRLYTAAFRDVYLRGKTRAMIREWITMGVLHGLAFLKPVWDERAGQVTGVWGDEGWVRDGEYKFEVVPLDCLIFRPMSSRELIDAPCVVHLRRLARDQAAEMYGPEVAGAMRAGSGDPDWRTDQPNVDYLYEQRYAVENDDDDIVVWDCYILPSTLRSILGDDYASFPDGRFGLRRTLTGDGATVLRDEPLPEAQIKSNLYPFIPFTFGQTPQTLYGDGVAERVQTEQLKLNIYQTLLANVAFRMAMFMVVAPLGYGADIEIAMDAVLEVDMAAGEDIKQFQFQAPPQDLPKYIEDTRRTMLNLVQLTVHDVPLPAVEPDKINATSHQILLDKARGLRTSIIEQLEDSLTDLGLYLASDMPDRYSPGRVLKLADHSPVAIAAWDSVVASMGQPNITINLRNTDGQPLVFLEAQLKSSVEAGFMKPSTAARILASRTGSREDPRLSQFVKHAGFLATELRGFMELSPERQAQFLPPDVVFKPLRDANNQIVVDPQTGEAKLDIDPAWTPAWDTADMLDAEPYIDVALELKLSPDFSRLPEIQRMAIAYFADSVFALDQAQSMAIDQIAANMTRAGVSNKAFLAERQQQA